MFKNDQQQSVAHSLGIDKQHIADVDGNNKKDVNDTVRPSYSNMSPKKRWTSAFRVVTAMARFRNMPRPSPLSGRIVGMRKSSAGPSFFYSPSAPSSFNHPHPHQHQDDGIGRSGSGVPDKSRTASSSFSDSSESVPNSGNVKNDEAAAKEPDSNIDPVYLALKEATEKYGNKACKNRRFSQGIIVGSGGGGDAAGPPPMATTASSSRNLSQASLLDSGTFSASGDYGSSSTTTIGNNSSCLRLFPITSGGGSTPQLQAGNSRGCRIKLTEKMKSFSLDCAEPPSSAAAVTATASSGGTAADGGGGMYPRYRVKPLRSARALTSTGHADSFDQAQYMKQRSSSPSSLAPFFGRRTPRRLPTVPDQQQQEQNATTVTVMPQQKLQQQQQQLPPPQQQQQLQPKHLQNAIVIPSILHIVTHEYIGADCALRPGERLVVVDNGDPDWKHGFKLNDRLERLFIFPSTCIAAYKTEEEQPMRLTQTCNLMDQKMRLYRDQVVFVQPNSLGEDGRVTVRNEHDKLVKCPLQFLILA